MTKKQVGVHSFRNEAVVQGTTACYFMLSMEPEIEEFPVVQK